MEPPTTSTSAPPPVPTVSIVDIADPQLDYLLVRRDAHSRQIGVGIGGRAIIAPETAQDLQPCRTGTVLKVGPSAPECYLPGSRIAFGSFAMTVLEKEGEVSGGADEQGAIGLVASTDVLCTFAPIIETDCGNGVPEVLPDSPLAVEGVRFARAVNGQILVERSILPNARGKILMPGTYTGQVQSMEARIVDTNFETPSEDASPRFWGLSFWPVRGDLILLAPQAGRPIPFGRNRDRILYSITPSQILCRITDVDVETLTSSIGRDAVDQASDPRRYISKPEYGPDVLGDVFDEGDSRAPR